MTLFRMAFLNLIRRPTPTIIAILAISLSIAVSGTLLRLYRLTEARFDGMMPGGDVIVGPKAGGIDLLLGSLNLENETADYVPQNLFETIRAKGAVKFEDGASSQPSQIDLVIPLLFFADFKGHKIIGTDSAFWTRPKTEDNPQLQAGHWPNAQGEVVLGAFTASEESLNLNDHIQATALLPTGRANTKNEMTVVGIMAPTKTRLDRAAISDLAYGQQVLQNSSTAPLSTWGNHVLSYFLIYLNPMGEGPLKELINHRTVAQFADIENEKLHLQGLTGTGHQLGVIIGILILFLGALTVTAMMVSRFDAMSIQIAVLRALGYGRREITGWLVWEGLLLGLTACFIGLTGDAIFFPILRNLMGETLPPASLVPAPLYWSAVVWITASLGTLLSVFIPLIRVYRQNVHNLLKGI